MNKVLGKPIIIQKFICYKPLNDIIFIDLFEFFKASDFQFCSKQIDLIRTKFINFVNRLYHFQGFLDSKTG